MRVLLWRANEPDGTSRFPGRCERHLHWAEEAVSIRTIFDTCRPRGDVMHGTVAEADFAADLAQVVTGGGSPSTSIPSGSSPTPIRPAV